MSHKENFKKAEKLILAVLYLLQLFYSKLVGMSWKSQLSSLYSLHLSPFLFFKGRLASVCVTGILGNGSNSSSTLLGLLPSILL